MPKNKFPKKLIVICDESYGESYFIAAEMPEDINEEYADKPVAIYELVSVGKFTVEKQVNAKPIPHSRNKL